MLSAWSDSIEWHIWCCGRADIVYGADAVCSATYLRYRPGVWCFLIPIMTQLMARPGSSASLKYARWLCSLPGHMQCDDCFCLRACYAVLKSEVANDVSRSTSSALVGSRNGTSASSGGIHSRTPHISVFRVQGFRISGFGYVGRVGCGTLASHWNAHQISSWLRVFPSRFRC